MNLVEQLDLSTHVHATEDEAKVVKALLNLIPTQIRNNTSIVSDETVGHFGNKIKSLKVTFKGEESLSVLRHILSLLDSLDREILLLSLNERFNEGKLYLRFSKQLAYRGIIRLEDSDDVIKAVVRINHWIIKKNGIENIIRELINQAIKA